MPYDQSGQFVYYDPAGYGAPDVSNDVPEGFGQYPTLGNAINRQKGVLGPALQSGMYDLGGMLGAGVGAVGGALGADGLRDWGVGVSNAMQQRSEAAGRRDLEAMPWSDEWGKYGQTAGDIPAWLLYQMGKQVPQVGAALLGGGVVGAGMRAAEIAAPGVELAATLPEWMGGGGMTAGMSALEQDAARAAGKDLAERYVGTSIAGMPQAAGSMYQSEIERSQNTGTPLDQGAAAASLGLSPLYSMLDAAAPSQTIGMLKRGLSGNIGKRLATAALSEGAQEMVQEATQTGMEMAFRPDLSMADKAQNIIDAALVGGAVGGAFGSVGGIRRVSNADPATVPTAAIGAALDDALNPQSPVTPASLTPVGMTNEDLNDIFKGLNGGAPQPDQVNQLYATLSANGGGARANVAMKYAQLLGIAEKGKSGLKNPVDAAQTLRDRISGLSAKIGPLKPREQELLDKAQTYLPIVEEAANFWAAANPTATTPGTTTAAPGAATAPTPPTAAPAAPTPGPTTVPPTTAAPTATAAAPAPPTTPPAAAAPPVTPPTAPPAAPVTPPPAAAPATDPVLDALAAAGGQRLTPLVIARQTGIDVRDVQARLDALEQSGDVAGGGLDGRYGLVPKGPPIKAPGAIDELPPLPAEEIPAAAPFNAATGVTPSEAATIEQELTPPTADMSGAGQSAVQVGGEDFDRLAQLATQPSKFSDLDRQVSEGGGNWVQLGDNLHFRRTERGGVAYHDSLTNQQGEAPSLFAAVLDMAERTAAPAASRVAPTPVATQAVTAPAPDVEAQTAAAAAQLAEAGVDLNPPQSDFVHTKNGRTTTGYTTRQWEHSYQPKKGGILYQHRPGGKVNSPVTTTTMVTNAEELANLPPVAAEALKGYFDADTATRREMLTGENGALATALRAAEAANPRDTSSQPKKQTKAPAQKKLTAEQQEKAEKERADKQREENKAARDALLNSRNNLAKQRGEKLFAMKDLSASLPENARDELLKLSVHDFRPGPMSVIVKIGMGEMMEPKQEGQQFARIDKERAMAELAQAIAGERVAADTVKAVGKIIDQMNNRIDRQNKGLGGPLKVDDEIEHPFRQNLRTIYGDEVMERLDTMLTSANKKPLAEINKQLAEIAAKNGEQPLILTPKQARLLEETDPGQKSKVAPPPKTVTRAQTRPAIHSFIRQLYQQADLAREFAAANQKHSKFLVAWKMSPRGAETDADAELATRALQSQRQKEDAAKNRTEDGIFPIDKTQGAVGEPLVATSSGPMAFTHATTVRSLYQQLLRMSQNKALRQLAPLLNKIRDVPVYFASPSDVRAKSGGDAYYDAKRGHIVMSDAAVSNDDFAQWFLHEAVHAALQDRLDNSPAMQRDLQEIMDRLKKETDIDPNDYALRNPSEFLAEALSRPDLQALLGKVKMDSQETGWRALVNKALRWLGWKGDATALENVMRAQRVLEKAVDPNTDMKSYIEEQYGKDIDKTLTDAEHSKENQRLFAVAARTTTAGTDTILSRLTAQIDRNMENMTGTGLAHKGFKARKIELYWSSFGHILSKWGSIFGDIADTAANAVAALGKHMTQRQALTARMARLFGVARDQLEAFNKKNPTVKAGLNRLMAITTEFGIDPEKSWQDNLKANKRLSKAMTNDPAGRGAQLRNLHTEAQQIYNTLNKTASVGASRSIYHVYRDLNNTLMHSYQAVQLYNLAKSDPYFVDTAPHNSGRPSLDLVLLDPVERFLEQTNLHEDPHAAAKYWEKSSVDRIQQMRGYLSYVTLQQKQGRLNKSQTGEFERSYNPMIALLTDLEKQIKTMKEAPYFHLGRHGDFIVRFKMRPDPASVGGKEEKVLPDVIEKVSERLKDIYPDVQISPESDRPFVMVRFENKSERDRFHDAIQQLVSEGLVVPGSVEAKVRSDMKDAANNAPAWLERYIENIQADPALDDTQKTNMISIARVTWLDQLADTAVARVLAQRQFIPGYSTDMLRNYAFRAEVGVNSLANLSIAAKVTEAFTDMKKVHEGLATRDREKADIAAQVINELQTRDAERPMTTGRDWMDEWRATNQAFFLGMSPAYTLVNMSQLGVMLLPELAKKHGFVKSAKAISSVTKTAFKIIGETFKEGKKIGWSRAFDAIITGDVLSRAGLSPEMHAFLTRMINSGNIDLGSPMRELGRAAEGIESSKWDQALRFASSMGYYSETLTRLIAAMSAHELMAGQPDAKIDQYAGGVLNDAMLNYSNWFTARATGKTGVLGRFTPIPASFQQYNMQVLQKLYRELFDAFSAAQPGESPDAVAQRKVEARRFLMGHATVLAVLAGSLGLPFTTVALRLVDFLRDELGDDDDEPHDTKTDYRNFLSDVFGPEIGEIMAHGLPRAFGFDVSSRIGEQDMFPLSRFLNDRRKMQDRVTDLVVRSAGSPVGMAVGIANGGYEFVNGNYMQGLQMMVPNSIKGVLKAADMAANGYHDAKGVPLAIQPGLRSIAYQALGFNPAEKAEDTERNMAMTTRKTLLRQRASSLRNELVDEAQSGGITPDTMARATRFDTKNPLYATLPTLGSTIQRRQKDAAIASATGSPLGLNPADLQERNRLRFANVRR